MRIKRNESSPPDVDMTPMIDMTFQLICFFMVALSFDQADRSERVKLPASELAKPGDVPFEMPITLQLTKEGTVVYGGEEMALANVGSRLDIEYQVMERLNKNPKNATVVIRADAEAETGKVQELIEACQQRSFEKFALRAQQEEQR